ncbi:MAG: hypothetical protein ACRENG_13760 [bacterium]
MNDLAIDNYPRPRFSLQRNGAVRDQGERESIVILIETEVIKTMMLWRITPKFAVWQWMCRGTLPLSAAFKKSSIGY